MKRLLICCALSIAAARPANASAATLQGRITAGPSLAAPPPVSVSVDAWACAPDGRLEDPSLRIGPERGLADVVVRIEGTKDAPPYPSKGAVALDQRGCAFIPHLIIVAPGQDVIVKNSDAVLHNFHTLARANRSVNQAQVKGKEDTFRFSAPEIIPVECDVHYWMSAVVVVAQSAWTAATGPDGTFQIEGLVPGDYIAALWHQRLGARTAAVHIDDGGGRLDLEWAGPSATSAP